MNELNAFEQGEREIHWHALGYTTVNVCERCLTRWGSHDIDWHECPVCDYNKMRTQLEDAAAEVKRLQDLATHMTDQPMSPEERAPHQRIDDLPLPVQLARARDTIKEMGIENARAIRENSRLTLRLGNALLALEEIAQGHDVKEMRQLALAALDEGWVTAAQTGEQP